MNDARYKSMIETTNFVKVYLLNYFNSTKLIEIENFSTDFMYLFTKRNDTDIWLRPYIVRSVFETVSNADWKKILPAATAAEVFNISTYQSNSVFDDKINSSNISNVNQFISSFVSFNIVNSLLLKLECGDTEKLNCIEILNKNNEDVYFGQFIDLNNLITSNIHEIMSMTKSDYISLYKKRCDLIGGTTVENCAFWSMEVANVDSEIKSKVLKLFRIWGGIMQKINDLSDFTIFLDRKNYKRYTDVRAGKVTLPFYLIANRLNEKELNAFILNSNKNNIFLDSFFSKYLYVDSDIVKDVFLVIAEEWQECRQIINSLKGIIDTKKLSFLYENIFLTRFVKPFFSNKLIRTL